MKKAIFFLLFIAILPLARADWTDLKEGMTRDEAFRCVGIPLMKADRVKGWALWSYDRGGYLMFINERLSYWELPKSPKN